MPFKEFPLNETLTLVKEDEIWSLYIDNVRDRRSIEEILDKNGNVKVCSAIRQIIKEQDNPFESEPVLEPEPEPEEPEPAAEELIEVESGDGEVLTFKKPEPKTMKVVDVNRGDGIVSTFKVPEEKRAVAQLKNTIKKETVKNDKVKEDSKEVKEPVKTPLLDKIHQYVGSTGVLEVFGETRGGKSRFCMEVAREAIRAGKTVFFLDTEDNVHEDTIKELKKLKGLTYVYTPDLNEINKYCSNMPDVDLVIIDSIGFPILVTFAKLSLNKKGNALLNLIAAFGDLKLWAYKTKGLVLVTNQPESEFNKTQDHIYRPFGDKSQFAVKEIWKVIKISSKEGETKIAIKTFGSRIAGMGTKVLDMIITDFGVKLN